MREMVLHENPKSEFSHSLSAHCEFAKHQILRLQRKSAMTGRTAACPSMCERQQRAVPEVIRFLLISGTPIDELVARHGPIVMLTQELLTQAMRDRRNGTSIKATH